MQASRVLIRKTKLQPPQNEERTIERARLTAPAGPGLQSRITLLTAPAGSGKTTAMIQAYHYLRGAGFAACWASLDEADNDPVGLTALIVAALRSALPHACTATAILLETGLLPPETILQRTLVNELSDIAQDVTLFLDDYHCLVDASAIKLMNLVFEANPEHLRFFIATRNDHNIPVARWRMLGAVRELTFEDLRFDEGETQTLLRFWGHTDITENQVDMLRRKTEGWVAGLQLASIALAGERDKGSFISAFSGTNKRIDGFISDELFQKHPKSVQDFLLSTSILDRFTLDLCNAVNPNAANHESLDYIEGWNLFLIPLDDERTWFRYHHLFTDYLRRKLHQLRPERVAELHKLAAAWLFEHDMITDAVNHAFASGDNVLAGRLLDEGSDALFSAGRAMTMEAYARRLPEATVRTLPRLLLDRAWEHELRWNFREAQAALAAARQAVDALGRSKNVANPRLNLGYLKEKLSHREMMFKLLSDDSEGARAAAAAWLDASVTDDGFMHGSTLSAKILTDREFFHFDLVMSRAEEVRNIFVEHGAPYGTVFHDSIVGRSLQMCGRIDEAVAILSRSLDVAIKLHGPHTPLASMPISLLASIAYERNALDEARTLLDDYLPLTKELGFVDNMMMAFLTSIRLAYLDRDFAEVSALLDEAECAASQFHFDKFQGQILLERIRLAALDPFFARTLNISESSILPDAYEDPWALQNPSTRHATAALVHCELLIQEDKPQAAITILKRWLRFLVGRHAWLPAAAFAAALARSHIRGGDVKAAQNVLHQILKSTAKSRIVRTFSDHGPVLNSALVAVYQAAQNEQDHQLAARVLAILNAAGATSPNEAAAGASDADSALYEPLTERELKILQLADDGLSNGEIASVLVISESTVKWYWQRIYDKFATRGRRRAIRRARTIGVIHAR